MKRNYVVPFNILCLLLALYYGSVQADETPKPAGLDGAIQHLDKPMYNPFIERYLVDEVKNLRTELYTVRAELIEKQVDKQLTLADKSMTYAINTITYFFYLIAGVSTLMVLVGWNSLKDIKQRVNSLANEEVQRITSQYENRLKKIEDELNKKSTRIRQTQEEINTTNEIHSLWLRASQENSPHNKIPLYDQILAIRPEDTEALTYKADAALQLRETLWAVSLCNRALQLDPENAHAYYQRACAHAEAQNFDEALRDLDEAIRLSEAFKWEAIDDASFNMARERPEFQALLHLDD
jgi:tetratricopeptide (TPR) repeat protein